MNFEALGYTPPPSKLKFYTERLGKSGDLINFLYDAPEKLDNLNEAALLNFKLAPDTSGRLESIRPKRGDYIIFETSVYGVWFTGYVTNEPDLEYLGGDPTSGDPVWAYSYNATSDDHLLNQQPVGLIAPFLNTTHGEIIRTLAEQLAPGRFDLSQVQDGLSVARYVPDPKKTFAAIVKELADLSNYRYYAKSKALFFQPQDHQAASFNIDRNDPYFTPDELSIRPTADPIINDAIVLGGTEPREYINEYFVCMGDNSYDLMSSIYGVDSSIFLDEAFGNANIDDSKWDVFDTPNNWLQPSNGFLNVLGGNQTGALDVWMQTKNLIPLEGNLRITHGEYDFIGNTRTGMHGVVCGLWTGDPNVSYTGCIFGLSVEYGSEYRLYPIVNGVRDTVYSFKIDTSKRYFIRTLVNCRKIFRQQQQYSYVSSQGTVGNYGGAGTDDYADLTTILTEYDMSTQKVTRQQKWIYPNVQLDSTKLFAYYVPVASNDLHCTVSNITISTPMQVALSYLTRNPTNDWLQKMYGIQSDYNMSTANWIPQIVGYNDMQVFDGNDPVATVMQTSSSSKSSYLGTQRYNPGNARLVLLKDSNLKQVVFGAGIGDIIHIAYRRPGTALARVQDKASILRESQQWHDNGHRTATTSDLDPAPRTSAECELAAAALVQQRSRTHYEGSYTTYSSFVSGEPVTGTILAFMNLPTTVFPNPVQDPIPPYNTGEVDDNGNPIFAPGDPNRYNFYEQVLEVRTRLLTKKAAMAGSGTPTELFEHAIKFGKQDVTKELLTKFTNPSDVFSPQESAETPEAIDFSVLGETTVPNVTAPRYSGYDTNQIVFDAGQDPPAGGGFEVRYTDSGWGIDDGKNFITRTTTRNWSVPRTSRGRVCFVRAYDKRNLIRWSEDMTQPVWGRLSSTTVSQTMMTNADGKTQLVNKVTMPVAGSVFQNMVGVVPANQMFVANVDIYGASGVKVRLKLSDSGGTTIAFQDYTLNDGWQRLPVVGSGSSSQTNTLVFAIENLSGVGQTIYPTRVQVESGRSTETVYCKTQGSAHGAYSRYSSGLRVQFPLKPPAPLGADIDATNPTAPIIKYKMPDNMSDVWGIEMRAADNALVFFHQDRTSESYTEDIQVWGNKNRFIDLYLYTYNVLGEYSDPHHLQVTLPEPTVTNLRVDNSDKTLKFDFVNAGWVAIEVWYPNAYSPVYTWPNITQNFVHLPDNAFFPQCTFWVVAYDALGPGQSFLLAHEYIPSGLIQVDSDNVTTVPPPPTPVTNPTPPPTMKTRTNVFVDEGWRNYRINTRLRYE